MNEQQIALLVNAQGENQAALSQYAATVAGNAAKSFDAWYDHAEITTWATALAAQVQAVQSHMASSTDAYLAEALADIKGTRVAPAGTISVTNLRKGVTPAGVYGRSADVFRYQRSLGKTVDEAQDAAVQRAQVMAQTDVQLAARAQSHKFMVVKHVSGFRRVVHPEMSRGGSCGLCIGASTRIYHRADLMPLHARCACTTMPILNDIDPGGAINTSDLNALYKQAGSTAADKLKRVRYDIHHDGEIGPVLGVKGQAFRSPADVAAADAA